MNQGLCLFGTDGRLAVANRKFGAMFGVPVTGDTAMAIMERSGLGLLSDSLSGGCEAVLSFELTDGRSLAVSQRPLDGGGWVVTFEDVTERRAAEARLTGAIRPLEGFSSIQWMPPNRATIGGSWISIER